MPTFRPAETVTCPACGRRTDDLGSAACIRCGTSRLRELLMPHKRLAA